MEESDHLLQAYILIKEDGLYLFLDILHIPQLLEVGKLKLGTIIL